MDEVRGETTCGHQMSTGDCCVSKASRKSKRNLQANRSNHHNFKINKLLNFKIVLKKLTEYNLFPHKIKAITNEQPAADTSPDKSVDSSYSTLDELSCNTLDDSSKSSVEDDSQCIKSTNESSNKQSFNHHDSYHETSSSPFANQQSTSTLIVDKAPFIINSSLAGEQKECFSTKSSANRSSSPVSSPHQTNSLCSHKALYQYKPLCQYKQLYQPYHSLNSLYSPNKSIFLSAILFILLLSLLANLAACDHVNLPPRFVTLPGYSSDIVLSIKEGNSSLNKEIYRLAGEDPNGDRLRFGVLGAIGNDILRIENDVPKSNQATIYLRKELDRETQPSYSLVLTLTDGKMAKGSYITKSLVIIVDDENDNYPVFRPLRSSTLHLSEFAKPGTILETVEAIDQDEGRFGQVTYAIEEVDKEPNANRTFSIDTRRGKGVISLTAPLDYERKHLYQLRIIANDLALEPKSTSTMLLVKVDDEPDQPPIFTFVPPVTRVQENLPIGTEIVNVKAVDGDREVNNAIRYSITKGNSDLFTINSTTGVISVAGELDREKAVRSGQGTGAYILEIRATEIENNAAEEADWEPISNEQNSVTTEITIMLQDVNDECPRFAASEYVAEIEENAQPDTPVRFVDSTMNREQSSWLTQSFNRVYDYDQGSNGTFTLRLIGEGASNFEISPTEVINEASFIIKVKDSKALDYEMVKRFQLEILAIETMPSYDSDLKKEIYKTNSQFSSDENNIYSSRVRITILVKDLNDNFPLFDKHTLGITNDNQRTCFQVNEFHQEGSLITRISATDADEPASVNGKVRFSIVGGNELNLFDIVNDGQPMLEQFSPTSPTENNNEYNNHHLMSIRHFAKVVSKHSLRDRIGNYTLNIKVQDYGHPSREITDQICITIFDVNDQAPVFKQPLANQTLKIPENTTVDSVLFQIEAVDADRDMNAVVNYRLVELPNNHWKSFSIDRRTGKLVLKQPLNRMKVKNYHLQVEAYDLGQPTSLSTKQDLNILITKVHDPKPKFPQSELHLSFTENVPPGVEQRKIVATVAKYDEEEDDRLFSKQLPCYYIVGGQYKERFRLNIFTHNLSAKVLLDREEQDNYTLIIQASNDCMHEPNNVSVYDPNDRSQLLVKIKIKGNLELFFFLNVNDNSPRFIKDVFTGGVTTESSFGTVFMNVKAIDPDEGLNGKIRYSIIGSSQSNDAEFLENVKNDPFVVNADNGEISLNFDPQLNMKGYFEFDVMANDTDNLQDVAKVKIYLLRNDQRVLFVLRLTPQEIRERLEKFRDVLSNITGAIVNVDNYKFHTNEDGSVDKLKTDLYLHFVNPNDNLIMDVRYVLTLIDKNIDYLDELYKDFNVLLSKPTSEAVYALSFDDQLKLILFGSNAFLVLLLILVVSLCFNQKNRYERKLKAATTSAYSIHPQLAVSNVPNTNLHADAPNPIWIRGITGYDNEWFKDEDQISHNSNDHNNSLDENMVVSDPINNYSIGNSLNNSLNGSSSDNVTESNSTNNDQQMLCNNNLNNLKNNNSSNLIKSNLSNGKATKQQAHQFNGQSHSVFKPPKTSGSLSCSCGSNYLEHSEITCKNSRNSILITNNNSVNHPQYLNNVHLVNHLNNMNLETTEL